MSEVITKEWLARYLKDEQEWFINNGLLGFPHSKLDEIKGDYNNHIIRLRHYTRIAEFLDYREGEGSTYEVPRETRKYGPDGKLLSTRCRLTGKTETYSYNDAGQCTQIKGSDGSLYEYEYDSNGFTSKVVWNGQVIKYVNDERGNAIKTEYGEDEYEEAVYDAHNNRILTFWPSGFYQIKHYDDNNQSIRMFDSYGHGWEKIRNDKGKVIQKKYSDGTVDEFKFDCRDNLIYKNAKPLGEIRFNYCFHATGQLKSISMNENIILEIPLI